MNWLIIGMLTHIVISSAVFIWFGVLLLKVRDDLKPRPNDPEGRW
jgi:hypothetical protein